MSRKQVEVTVGPIVLLLTFIFIGYQASNERGAYNHSVSELYAREGWFEGKQLRVKGGVVPDSIVRGTDRVEFVITGGKETLEVHYVGANPLPDTLRDYSEAVVVGQYSGNGLFNATSLEEARRSSEPRSRNRKHPAQFRGAEPSQPPLVAPDSQESFGEK